MVVFSRQSFSSSSSTILQDTANRSDVHWRPLTASNCVERGIQVFLHHHSFYHSSSSVNISALPVPAPASVSMSISLSLPIPVLECSSVSTVDRTIVNGEDMKGKVDQVLEVCLLLCGGNEKQAARQRAEWGLKIGEDCSCQSQEREEVDQSQLQSHFQLQFQFQ